MDWNDGESGFAAGFPPALVSLTPFPSTASPTPRRLSSCFTQPAAPVRSIRRLAWVSLQGRLVGAEEASSAKTVDPNGVFTAKEAAAWELFTPAQRVLTVAVVGAAASDLKKNEQISNLKKSVQLRVSWIWFDFFFFSFINGSGYIFELLMAEKVNNWVCNCFMCGCTLNHAL